MFFQSDSENVLDRVYISISGIIGAGKSTLAKALGEQLGLPVHYEPVADNEYLADFYSDMKRYGFALQVYLLNKRFAQHQKIIWDQAGGVQDRSIYEDMIFAKVLRDQGDMDERDYRTYLQLFRNMSNYLRHPHIIVHLDVTPEEALERIHIRSRGVESGITIEYLRSLHEHYDEFIEEISRSIPVIRVRWDKFRSVEETAAAIAKEYYRLRAIRTVCWTDTVGPSCPGIGENGQVPSLSTQGEIVDLSGEQQAK